MINMRNNFAYFFRKTFVVGCSLEMPRGRDSNEHTQQVFMKKWRYQICTRTTIFLNSSYKMLMVVGVLGGF